MTLTRSLPIIVLAGLVAEIASIIWVGKALGIIPTILLLLVGGVVGVKVLKSVGTSVMEAFRSPVQTSSPIRGVGGMALTRVFAGLLFIVPGFFSDALALLILLPPVQGWIRSRFRVEPMPPLGERQARPFTDASGGTVIEGEAIEIVVETDADPTANRRAG